MSTPRFPGRDTDAARVRSAAAAGPETASTSADAARPSVDAARPGKGPAAPIEQESLRPQWKALAALCIGFFMILLDQTIVAVATPQLYAQLDATLTEVVWVTSSYLLCFAVPLLVTGRLGDRYGQREVYMVGMAVFTLSSLACGLSQSVHALIIARAVQGIGAALLTPQTMSVINRIFPRHRRGAAMGVWGAVAGLANLAGPLLGGLLVSRFGWQWIFFVNVPIGVVSIVLVWAWVPALERVARRIDLASVAISMIGMFALVFAVQQGPALHYAPVVWVLFALALCCVVAFIALQRRAAHAQRDPLVPLQIFGYRNFSIGAFSIAMMGFCVNSMMLPVMLFLQSTHGMSAQQASFLLIPMALVAFVLAPVTGRMSDWVHPRTMSLVGFGGCVLVLGAMTGLMLIDAAPLLLMIPLTLFGVASAFVWAPNSVATMRELTPELSGAGSGVYNTTRQLGSVIGAAAVGAVLSTSVALAMSLPMLAMICGLVTVSKYTFPKPENTLSDRA
ncbi:MULTISPECIES: DHA2 family efflux MFS transporter permease subunit [Corynebacterium]|uniref:DHA2 family efflux MFS transporter permease subunit n=1 Tax=Corynebacterium TaxID=1716 RepID=UPI00124D2018|nr:MULTISPECIES: DHA2 family efflux MFS transporter permease subunit [Corynebacterium]